MQSGPTGRRAPAPGSAAAAPPAARARSRPRPDAAELARAEAVGLTGDEYARIAARLGRRPNDLELGLFGAMWSEHCSYKSSRAYLGRLPSRAPQVLMGPGENAGVLDLGDGWALAVRIESHNHPSAVEPFEGAATGVGGILRDVFAVGARPVALLDGLCFGPLDDARSRYLFGGVVAGIAHYGNSTGVPTVGGQTVFDPAYARNPLVNVMCVGLLPRERLLHGVAPGPGSPVLLVGNRTGRDGIHGASLLASRSFVAGDGTGARSAAAAGGGSQSPPAGAAQSRPTGPDSPGAPDPGADASGLRPAVQVGDPFVGKLLIEACLELAERDLLAGLNDLGAAGITSAASETASRAGTGIDVDVARVPLRAPAMTPYEVMLSESQERMLLVPRDGCELRVREVCRRWGLEAAVVGRVTADGRLTVRAGSVALASVPVRALTDGAPRYRRPQARPRPAARFSPPDADPGPDEAAAWLGRLVTSRRWVYRQYDHTVQTGTVVPPGAGDAAVLRRRGSVQGVALALEGTGRVAACDPWCGGARAVADAVRSVACAGARSVGLTDCLNFGSPEDPAVMGSFRAVLAGLAAACRALGVPVTGGNVSFYNDTGGSPVHPTAAVGMVGLLADVRRARGAAFRSPGDLVLLLGPSRGRLDGSLYQLRRWQAPAGRPARPDWRLERALVAALTDPVAPWASAHVVGSGGLAAALAECCLLGGLGGAFALPAARGRLDERLFGEGAGRVVVSLPAVCNVEDVRSRLAAQGVPCHVLGSVTDGPGVHIGPLGPLDLRAAWEEGIPRWFA